MLTPLNRLLVTALGLALAGACAAAEIRTCAQDPESRAIAEAYQDRWRNSLASADTAAIASLYDEAAVLMPPTDETFVGREPIVGYLRDTPLPARAPRYSVDLVSCARTGNALHVAGVWGQREADGQWQGGNLLRVLEQTPAGTWVASYEIWN